MQPEEDHIRHHSEVARALCEPIIARGGGTPADSDDLRLIDESGQAVNLFTHAACAQILKAGKIPGLIGGDHSTPFGAIRACAEHINSRSGLGILHLDAHMDLRNAFEGFRWSHASIMFNVLEKIPEVSRIVQVGIRDFGLGELEYARSHGHGSNDPAPRVRCHFDLEWVKRLDAGESFASLCEAAISHLPQDVYVSFDIDALEPALCPHTGTPVPGGLSFSQACMMLEILKSSGRRVIGFDLVEVCPGPDQDEPDLDSNVGARVLYKLCGLA
jgi:agmatinase